MIGEHDAMPIGDAHAALEVAGEVVDDGFVVDAQTLEHFGERMEVAVDVPLGSVGGHTHQAVDVAIDGAVILEGRVQRELARPANAEMRLERYRPRHRRQRCRSRGALADANGDLVHDLLGGAGDALARQQRMHGPGEGERILLDRIRSDAKRPELLRTHLQGLAQGTPRRLLGLATGHCVDDGLDVQRP